MSNLQRSGFGLPPASVSIAPLWTANWIVCATVGKAQLMSQPWRRLSNRRSFRPTGVLSCRDRYSVGVMTSSRLCVHRSALNRKLELAIALAEAELAHIHKWARQGQAFFASPNRPGY
jgi:hypothetical protein